MSRINPTAPRILRSTLALLCGGLFLSSSAPATAIGDACVHRAVIGLDTTQRHFADAAVQCFDIYVPESGLLMLEVTVPAAAQTEPRLDFHGPFGHGLQVKQYLERLPAGLLVEIRRPGTYRLGVHAQDPEQPLGEYRLRSGFAAVPFTKEGDPEEDEPDPDPQPIPGKAFEASRILSELCSRSQTDEHGDSLWCASPLGLGQEVKAEIGNEWGDDDDFFTFLLTDMETVRIESTGSTDTFGSLYDERGYRLQSDDDGGTGGNFRLVKTLTPGRYFVRVTGGDGAPGSYRLTVEVLGR